MTIEVGAIVAIVCAIGGALFSCGLFAGQVRANSREIEELKEWRAQLDGCIKSILQCVTRVETKVDDLPCKETTGTGCTIGVK